jgi:1-acyl-sn-glycerol-3-phosphate acyltransferase
MQCFRFLFLSRSWEKDQTAIGNVIAHMKEHREGGSFLIFPEGSDLSASNVAKSNAFAKERGLPEFRFVLNPRTTGLVAMKHMMGEDRIEFLYDITMGYTDHSRDTVPSEKNLVDGKMPRCVHFLISRYALKDLPQEDDAFRKWVEQKFEEKELLLSNFYQASPNGFEKRSLAEVFGSKAHIVRSLEGTCA